ncbi:LysR substrate-binding domain-containing protein [Azohydromonas lata]|uniref:LysR substrate-binding domain-containing protein n=1 Tax=Azohydromonas lata TaxID=45677 RepID=A0ABU5IR00_9BURK|nr:LysR substrate-binding domain-containing protein [Azohydromonas lata]MDZ5461330.1 LysR substrate-binding domain-containing protein [Azohydromonas lata]
MAPPRIPPIHCLQSFEALARLRSVTLAAEELSVTPSAVSHRMRQLESHLGVRLFARGDFTLTADGAAYLGHVRQGLRALQQLPGSAVQRTGAPVRLRLAVTPTFSREILLPKLALFRHAYPEVDLIMQVAIPLLDVKAEETDLEIRYGTGPYADVEQVCVLRDEVCPVCSPEYLNEAGPFDGFDSAEVVSRARLIRSPLEPWGTWFRACGIGLPEPRSGGTQFNDIGLMLDAAAAGFGVALARLRLAKTWLDNGRLVRLSARSVHSPQHHFLCWKPGTLERWECAAFVEWAKVSLG